METVITIVLMFIFFGIISVLFGICFIVMLNKIKNSQEQSTKKLDDVFSMLKKLETRHEKEPETKPKVAAEPRIPQETPVENAIPASLIGIVKTEKEPEKMTEPSREAKPESIHREPPAEKPLEAREKSAKPIFTHVEFKKAEPSEFEKKASEILRKIWSWIVVGEEFRNRNVSMEYAIASVWLLRSAIVIILTGIGFFLKYSIENNLVGPTGRVAACIIVGVGMLLAGMKMANKKYHIIAQGFLGGGIATLYFSIFASFAMYKLVDMVPAFAFMILITVAAAVLSLRLNSLLTAILGVIGGYCTPIILSTGQANFLGLYSYVLLLGIGVLAIAKYKDWKLLNALSFIFTYMLFWVAAGKDYNPENDFTIVIVFLSLFFILHAAIPLTYNIFREKKSSALTLLGMTANAAIYFPSSYYFINGLYGREWCATVTIGLAAFYVFQTSFFLKHKLRDRNLLIILTGFASFFITVTIPLLLKGEWITASWAIQAAVFLWMSSKMQSNLMRNISLVIYILAFGRFLFFDFNSQFIRTSTGNYFDGLLNRLVSFGSIILSAFAGFIINRKSAKTETPMVNRENDIGEHISQNTLAALCAYVVAILLFVYLHFEFRYLTDAFYPASRMTAISFVWFGALIFIFYMLKMTGKKIFLNLLIFLSFLMIFKYLIFDLFFWNLNTAHMLFRTPSTEDIVLRMFDFIPAAAITAFLYFSVKNKSPIKNSAAIFGIIALGFLFVYTTLELNTFLDWKAKQFRTGGISILWALYALSFVFSGIVRKIKALRYAGLVIFLIVILKVFLLDLSNLSQLARIIAFIGLGVLVLIGAFAYVRFQESFKVEPETGAKSDEE